MKTDYGLLADLVVFLHSLYVLFTVGGALAVITGGILGWKWIRNRIFRMLHLTAVLFVALESIFRINCFLTLWEYNLRMLAGQKTEGEISFVGRIIRSLIFADLPPWGFTLLYTGFGLTVLAMVFLFPPEKRKRKNRKN